MAREPNREYLFSIRPKCMITLTRYFVWIGNMTHIKDNAHVACACLKRIYNLIKRDHLLLLCD